MITKQVKSRQYPTCPDCGKVSLGVYSREQQNKGKNVIIKRLDEYIFCAFCDRMFRIDLNFRPIKK